jgi:hypothetical protein
MLDQKSDHHSLTFALQAADKSGAEKALDISITVVCGSRAAES